MLSPEIITKSPVEKSPVASQESMKSGKIAVLIPCANEERTIPKAIQDFQRELPDAANYAYDNNSSNRTALITEAAGAKAIFDKRQGEGFVGSSMFKDMEPEMRLQSLYVVERDRKGGIRG